MKEEARGLGIQTAVYKKIAETYPDIKIWKDDLIMENKKAFLLNLKEKLKGSIGYKEVAINPGEINLETKIGECCAEALNNLSPEKKAELYKEAIQGTPDYKSISKAGFTQFCGTGATSSFTKFASGAYHFKVNLELCR